jgi:hypothetical protein
VDLSNLSPDQLQKLKDTIGSKIWRLNNLYYIRDKNGAIVLLKLNPEQEYYITHRHYRNVNLKARQLGFTTIAVIDALDDCLFNEHFEAGIIADDLDNATKIFDKAKLAYSKLPEWLKKHRTPTTDRVGEYRFPNGSVFSVDTSFRGGTLSRLHVSELGKISKKWPNKAREIITGAFEAVPKNGFIDIESTAEGVSGAFYDICQEAMGKDEDNLRSLEFKFFFFPWWKNPEYQESGEVELSDELISYFKYLKDEQGIELTQAQKNWYALKNQSLKGEMHQEYPSFPEEAFLASGRPFFCQQDIAANIKRVKGRKFELKAFIIKDMEDNEHIVQVKIFEEPIKGKAYSIGGDPAEGLETGDNSALSVLSKDFDQVATYAGKLDPDLFGALLVGIAKYYNNAIVAYEANNHGHAVESAVKLRKYYKIFKREQKEIIGKDIKEKIGWLNTVKSKIEMLDDLKEAYRDGSLVVNDEETLREMLTVTIEEDGNVIVNGKDRVVCLGISIQAIKQASIEGEHKAFNPGKTDNKDPIKMTVEDRLKYYKRKNRHG